MTLYFFKHISAERVEVSYTDHKGRDVRSLMSWSDAAQLVTAPGSRVVFK